MPILRLAIDQTKIVMSVRKPCSNKITDFRCTFEGKTAIFRSNKTTEIQIDKMKRLWRTRQRPVAARAAQFEIADIKPMGIHTDSSGSVDSSSIKIDGEDRIEISSGIAT